MFSINKNLKAFVTIIKIENSCAVYIFVKTVKKIRFFVKHLFEIEILATL